MNSALKIQSLPKPIELIKKDPVKETEIESAVKELYSLLGWNTLPERLQRAVYQDVQSFSNELVFNYSSYDVEIRERKKRVHYWIGQYKAGNCTEETAVEMLLN